MTALPFARLRQETDEEAKCFGRHGNLGRMVALGAEPQELATGTAGGHDGSQLTSRLAPWRRTAFRWAQ